jgi:hypothetical protein
LDKIGGVLAAVAGSSVPNNVWEDIKKNLLSRDVIRRNVEIRLWIRTNPDLSDRHYEFDYEFSYELGSLVQRANKLEVLHGLDEHISAPAAHLPRFVAICVGTASAGVGAEDPWESDDKEFRVKNGRLSFKVALEAQGGTSVPISVRRREVRECPGSYFLVMTEVTDGLRIYLKELPEKAALSGMRRPYDGDHVITMNEPLFASNSVLLPGHAIEFRLKEAVKETPKNAA